MSTWPDISVVMSVFNNQDTLGKALESILDQKGIDLEFVVVNDGSTDQSSMIIDDYARRDNRIKPVHQHNQGLTAALRKGCLMASAPWIARQDADDVSLPGRLQKQLAAGEADPRIVLVGCQSRCRTEDGDLLSEVRAPLDMVEARRHVLELGRSISPHGTIMFRRSEYDAIGGYREPFYYAQDLDLNIRLAERGSVLALPEFLYEYRFTAYAISGSQAERQTAFRTLILESQRKRSRGESDADVLAAAETLSTSCRNAALRPRDLFAAHYFMGCCLRLSDPRKARDYFAKAIGAMPWSAKSWMRWLQCVVSAGGLK